MAASDLHGTYSEGLSSPCDDGEAITPHDTTEFTNVSRAIYVGVGGDVAVVMRSGDVLTFKNAASGSVLPVRAKRVNSTNTTATNLLALY